MTFEVIYTQDASDDIDRAFEWLAARAPGAAFDLLQVVARVEVHLARNPSIYKIVQRTRAGAVRRVNLRPFRYQLYYLIFDDEVAVISCLHASRSPRTHLRVVSRRARRT